MIREASASKEQLDPLFKDLKVIENKYQALRSHLNEAGWISSVRSEELEKWIEKLESPKITSLLKELIQDGKKLIIKSKKLGI